MKFKVAYILIMVVASFYSGTSYASEIGDVDFFRGAQMSTQKIVELVNYLQKSGSEIQAKLNSFDAIQTADEAIRKANSDGTLQSAEGISKKILARIFDIEALKGIGGSFAKIFSVGGSILRFIAEGFNLVWELMNDIIAALKK